LISRSDIEEVNKGELGVVKRCSEGDDGTKREGGGNIVVHTTDIIPPLTQ
jgi:hypothetical protein